MVLGLRPVMAWLVFPERIPVTVVGLAKVELFVETSTVKLCVALPIVGRDQLAVKPEEVAAEPVPTEGGSGRVVKLASAPQPVPAEFWAFALK